MFIVEIIINVYGSYVPLYGVLYLLTSALSLLFWPVKYTGSWGVELLKGSIMSWFGSIEKHL